MTNNNINPIPNYFLEALFDLRCGIDFNFDKPRGFWNYIGLYVV